ncbi:MAG: sugar phosphate isomerase/epimerase [Verrucomicrobiales bacterium]|nr:sugar phosphate isomerase/epimerase [Verrucomicrobiales bacterium]
MKLSLNSSTIKPTPLLDKIRVAGEAGYKGIELWAVELYEHVGRGGEISDVEKALADHGLEVPCFIAVRNWGESEGWEYKLSMDEARRRFELAARLGSPLMVCTPPIERPGLEGLHEGYTDLLKIGQETGVQAVLEYISFFASLNNVPDTVTVMNRCDPALNPVTILDAFHNWNNKTTLEDIAALPLEQIAHYHIDDAAKDIPAGQQKDPDRVMVGDGAIDLTSELTLLKEKGYNKWLSLELFSEAWWTKDPLECAKIGLERMEALCSEVGIVVD